MGIKTAWDYTQLPQNAVRKLFALPGFRTWQELRGIPCIEFEDLIEPRQSICVSRSFAHEITAPQELTSQVATFTESAVTKLREQGSLALELVVFAMTNRFKEDQLQTSAGLCVPLPNATDDHRTLVLAAADGCRRLYKPGYAYKKAGVVITKLVQAKGYTRSLFEDPEAAQKEASLSGAIDRINKSYGPGAILFGIQGDGKVKNAHEHQSPHYTTLWEDLPKVKVE
jgi:DNA polymerase V